MFHFNPKITFAIGVALLVVQLAAGQTKPVLPHYDSPLNLPVRLSATFGELRASHFHAGIDLKTQQKTGFPVSSIDDGYVLRLAVSPTGYGKAIYVAHPSGYTSVYGHLDGYAPAIDSLVEMQQYSKKSYSIDWEPFPGQIIVKKGQLIGFSGNSGGSGGPHLHFEIRDTRTQEALNPLDFGIAARDFIRPKMEFIKLYPGNAHSEIEGKRKAKRFDLAGWGPSYKLKALDTIRVSGSFAVGVASYDVLNYEPNHNGVWAVEMMADSVPFFNVAMNRIAFSDTRFIYALTDYAEYRATGNWLVWSKRLPGDRLPFVYSKNDGIVAVTPGQVVALQVSVKDQAGNVSVLRFFVKGEELNPTELRQTVDTARSSVMVQWNQPVHYKNEGLTFDAEAGAFYADFLLATDTVPRHKRFLSPVYRFHCTTTPIHKSAVLSLVPDRNPGKFADKLLVASVSAKGTIASVGGSFKNGAVVVKIREFGRFTIVMDTVAPVITPLNVKNKMQLDTLKQIRFRISDDFSGIASINPELNGQWHLMEYDAKNKLLFCSLKKFRKGENKFKIVLTDQKGNESVAEYILYR